MLRIKKINNLIYLGLNEHDNNDGNLSEECDKLFKRYLIRSSQQPLRKVLLCSLL